jgi:hypothetical protein
MKQVASTIAKGEPPDWLVRGLEHFVPSPGRLSRKKYREIIAQMTRATDTLLRYLPAFHYLGFGIRCPNDDVAVVLALLPSVRQELSKLTLRSRRSEGRPTDVQREICAAVVVEASKLINGKIKPRSLPLAEACDQYWQTWGGSASSDPPENWRRIIGRASRKNNAWIRSKLERYKNPTK